MPLYAEVALPVPLCRTFHYAVPERMAGRDLVGHRVLVPFGKRGLTGVVVAVADSLPEEVAGEPERVRAIERSLDSEAVLSSELLRLCLWMAEYYEAPPGEVLRGAVPGGIQVTSKKLVAITEAGRAALAEGGAVSRVRRDILGTLAAAKTPRNQGAVARGKAAVAELVALESEGLVAFVHQETSKGVKPRTVRTAVLTRKITEEDRAKFARSPKKLAALRALEARGGAASVAKLKAAEPTIAGHLRALAKAGLVAFEAREAPPQVARPRFGDLAVEAPVAPPALNQRQRAALAAIRAGLRQKRFASYLLYGITGSGKTEVYLNAIADVVAAGRTAVVLVPEISLTPQLAARFRARFGNLVAILHSGLKKRERFDEWQRLKSGSARIALGARSAIFAPVEDLGMVVVDEEHDSSFKQEEGVRYNARDVALVRAQRGNAICVLGSATPSLESFHAADSGRYQLLRLPERATARPLPEVELVDLRKYMPETEAMLTAPLSEAITTAIEQGEQVILFLNRRGFDTFVLCRACGNAFRCTDCSVSLTYHRYMDRLLCHYCGYARRIPDTCPECSARGTIIRKGLGTEKVADAIANRFAGARVARLDRDVAGAVGIEVVLGRMARREIDILVGTQMVTKGHDFPGVTLVGVLCADTGLTLPDFRASERTFQLLTQVAGRAGRGDRPGRVLIQSYRTDVVAVAAAAKHDYEGFYRDEIVSRRELGYPPFGYLVALRIDGPDPRAVEMTARSLADRARAVSGQVGAGARILGPCEAPLARLKGRTRWHLWLQAPDRKVLRRFLRATVTVDRTPDSRARITVDVDPMSAL